MIDIISHYGWCDRGQTRLFHAPPSVTFISNLQAKIFCLEGDLYRVLCWVTHEAILIVKQTKPEATLFNYFATKQTVLNHSKAYVSTGMLFSPGSNSEFLSTHMLHLTKRFIDTSQIAKFMGPTWVLSAPDGPHVGPMNLAIRGWVIWSLRPIS